jgi:hypothetical protein
MIQSTLVFSLGGGGAVYIVLTAKHVQVRILRPVL